MMPHRPRVRFAPSPTGDLHIGNARTALFNWLFARHNGGDFILRIEDTDQERTSKIFEKNLLEDLKWLSVEWDEGPGKGGEFGPYHQIERLDIYNGYLEKLIAEDRVYPCYCTEEELEEERLSLLAMKMMPRYMGKCRRLTEKEKKNLETEGRKPTFRFKVEAGPIEFNDLIRGAMKFEGEAIGDFIIVRSTGIPAYNFAVVVDDHLMGITHVIRGEDHLSNTAIQILLYRALAFTPPLFAHHALILGKDRSKLSKRHGSVSVREFRNKGILPEALINYLSLLGGSLGEGKELASVEELINMFSLDRAGKSGAIFDEDKLKWLNAIYIRNYDVDKLTELLLPFIKEAGYEFAVPDRSRLGQVVNALKDNLVTLADIGDYLDIFVDEKFRISEEASAILRGKTALPVLKVLREMLVQNNISGQIFYPALINSVRRKTGLKAKELYMPIRAAITGRTSGPELEKIFSILGKASILRRLEQAIQLAD
ncbi:MAG TPA: glutamate--tRNA ligase [Syntrophales bacterium]|nr:glutamate--tRNA ligase [Syntrophales bacterium]